MQWLSQATRNSDWSRANVVVAGIARSGFAAADALVELGAKVTVLDDSDSQLNQERANLLEFLDAKVRLGPGSSAELPADTDLVITSPGWPPHCPLLSQAAKRKIPIWGEIELAYRLMQPSRKIPILGITGTNGKTTTAQMTSAILSAANLKVATVGNIGRPMIEAVNERVYYDVFVAELSSFQLHYAPSLQLHSAVVLNLHQDHLEWYASYGDAAYQTYCQDKGRIYQGITHSCVYNVAEPATEQLVRDADVVQGARAIGFTLGIPGLSMLGVVDDLLVDRAFIPQRQDSALPLASVTDISPAADHNIANALAAAALARSFGAPARAVSQGLRGMEIGDHRIQTVAEQNQVRWVDDSKATNPHAANASLQAFDSVVWLAGGQAKGTNFDDLVAHHADRLKAAVVFGVDRQVIADALARHAPEVPVTVLDNSQTSVVAQAVEVAAEYAQPGDVVLLAPGCASKDIWAGYEQRGADFTAAVQQLLDRDNSNE